MTPVQDEDDAIDLENLKIVLRFVKKDFSRYTLFIPLFKFSKSFLRLEEKFSCYLKLKYNPKRYPVAKMADSVVSLVCCGVDRFVRMDDEFRIERGLAKSLGFPHGFFTSRTAYRFFQSFNGWNIRQLERINLETLKEQKGYWFPQAGSVFVDLDMNTKSVEGKKIEKAALGYNRKSPGRLSLNWSVGYIGKVAFFSELHSGTTSGRTTLKRQIEYLEKLIKRLGLNPQDPRFVFRVDGGYFSWDNLAFMNKRRFITRLPVNLTVLKPLLSDKNLKSLRWKGYGGASGYVDLGAVYFPDVGRNGEDFRIVLVRVYRKKKGKEAIMLYPLAANLLDWKAKSIVKAYRGRQVIEDCFRDTNQAFYSDKLPSSTFHGNQAFLWFVCLAYNLFFFFQKFPRDQKITTNDSKDNCSKVSEKGGRDEVLEKIVVA